MWPALTPAEIRALLIRGTRGTELLVWDGDRFFRVTPDALREALTEERDMSKTTGPA